MAEPSPALTRCNESASTKATCESGGREAEGNGPERARRRKGPRAARALYAPGVGVEAQPGPLLPRPVASWQPLLSLLGTACSHPHPPKPRVGPPSPCDCSGKTQALRARGLLGTWTPQDPRTGPFMCPLHTAQLSGAPTVRGGIVGRWCAIRAPAGGRGRGTLQPGATPGGRPGHWDLTLVCVCPGPTQAPFIPLIWGPLQ